MQVDNTLAVVLLSVALLVFGTLVFLHSGKDYRLHDRLSHLSVLLTVLVFVFHGAASYVYLNPRLSAIDTTNPLFGVSVVLVVGGLVLLFTSIGRLGAKKTLGRDPSGLYCEGIYRHSRNPQVVFYGLAAVGYALLWPSWQGVVWVVIYAVLAELMVRTEERHLEQKYGKDYVEYCELTPRYVDLPGGKKK
jgi:protein-S-isoprenylcysteine O-methyltransferase Ste14